VGDAALVVDDGVRAKRGGAGITLTSETVRGG
jgi:hypothetical protein